MFRKALARSGVTFALFLLASAPLQAAGMDLSGKYAVSGVNPQGDEYRGAAEIEKVGDIYRITWLIGKEEHHGVGLVQGDVLSVAWVIVAGGSDAGVVAYKIKKNGTLDGKWINDYEKGGVLPETLTPLK
jgi:hypothetical protein